MPISRIALFTRFFCCGVTSVPQPLAVYPEWQEFLGHEGDVRSQDETTADVFEVSGSVKWFDPSRDYGFIVPNENLPDILLHVTCLRRGGFQTVREGARVVWDVVRSRKGLQAFSIRSMDEFDGHPSFAIASSHPCRRHSRKRLGKSDGKMVQSAGRIWLSHPGSQCARYFYP